MHRYIIRRLLLAVPATVLALTAIFVVSRILPGDPAIAILGEFASQADIEELRQKMGLNVPLWQQYIEYIAQTFRGDLGNSILTGRPVSERILANIPYTFELAIAGVIVGIVVGIPLGVISGIRRGTLVDAASRIFALSGISFPAFYIGILFLLFFSVKLDWFPMIGAGGLDVPLVKRLHYLVLPAVSLGLIQSAVVMRITRSSLLNVLQQDYIQTARAKGLMERVVTYKHAFRNAMIPVMTVIGLNITDIIGGAVLTETVFSRPGLGTLLIRAIQTRDYTIVQGTVVVFAILVIVINLIVDMTYVVIDPRIKYE